MTPHEQIIYELICQALPYIEQSNIPKDRSKTLRTFNAQIEKLEALINRIYVQSEHIIPNATTDEINPIFTKKLNNFEAILNMISADWISYQMMEAKLQPEVKVHYREKADKALGRALVVYYKNKTHPNTMNNFLVSVNLIKGRIQSNITSNELDEQIKAFEKTNTQADAILKFNYLISTINQANFPLLSIFCYKFGEKFCREGHTEGEGLQRYQSAVSALEDMIYRSLDYCSSIRTEIQRSELYDNTCRELIYLLRGISNKLYNVANAPSLFKEFELQKKLLKQAYYVLIKFDSYHILPFHKECLDFLGAISRQEVHEKLKEINIVLSEQENQRQITLAKSEQLTKDQAAYDARFKEILKSFDDDFSNFKPRQKIAARIVAVNQNKKRDQDEKRENESAKEELLTVTTKLFSEYTLEEHLAEFEKAKEEKEDHAVGLKLLDLIDYYHLDSLQNLHNKRDLDLHKKSISSLAAALDCCEQLGVLITRNQSVETFSDINAAAKVSVHHIHRFFAQVKSRYTLLYEKLKTEREAAKASMISKYGENAWYNNTNKISDKAQAFIQIKDHLHFLNSLGQPTQKWLFFSKMDRQTEKAHVYLNQKKAIMENYTFCIFHRPDIIRQSARLRSFDDIELTEVNLRSTLLALTR